MQAEDDNLDQSLLQAIAGKNADALRQLYARHGLHLLNYLLGQLSDRQLAEEVLQNVMLAVWNQAAKFRGDSQVRTWIFAIAKRQMLKARRQVAPLDDCLDETVFAADNPYQAAERIFEREILATALGNLPIDQQEALELVFYRGLTIAEAASRLKISPNTLKSRLFRAKANLRRWLIAEEIDHE